MKRGTIPVWRRLTRMLAALDTIVVVLGVVLLLKRVADMENYHIARVAVLTVVLSYCAIVLLCGLAVTFGGFGPQPCVIEFDETVDHY